jgi:Flp pilus assembly protein TadD
LRPAPILALLAALAAPGAHADPVPFDPYDPVRLNERAVERVRSGDLAGARILLERAARLAPFDARVTENLRTLRAHEAGERAPLAAVTPPPAPASPAVRPAPAKPAAAVVAEPPALWPPVQGAR